MTAFGPLKFHERYQERIWGGQKLRSLYGKDIPEDKPIGEAWLVSDHPGSVSVVASGPHEGRDLHQLLEEDAIGLLGHRAKPTIHGRFPLLLKLLDAQVVLSVQVHPDDEIARQLGEPDVGKTEMWYVLDRDPGAELICGLVPEAEKASFEKLLNTPGIGSAMVRFPVDVGTAVFVPAGTVHAIASGVVVAEIQQNSDLTYRLYDWGRVEANGKPRELHLEKAMKAIKFGSTHAGPNRPLAYETDDTKHTVLACCEYFAAERVDAPGNHLVCHQGESFHILLATTETVVVATEAGECALTPGEALLMPAGVGSYEVAGETYLKYYVPDQRRDIEVPLLAAGHAIAEIQRLGMGR